MVCQVGDFILSWNITSAESTTVSQDQGREGEREVAVVAHWKPHRALRALYIVSAKYVLRL